MRARFSYPGLERIFEKRHGQRPCSGRPLRIALIAHLKYPIAQPYSGGLEMHTHLVARELSDRGHDVTLFASQGSDADNLVAACEPTGALTGRAEKDAEDAAYERIIAQVLSGGFDIVHNNSLHPLPLERAAFLPPMVTVLHTPPFTPLAEAAQSARAGRFISVSQSLAPSWRAFVHVDDIVPNGIKLDMFVPGGRRAVPPRLIWYGRIVPEKGLHLAIDAAKLAGFPLDVAGPIMDRDYWASEIAPRCDDTVSYLGHLDHATLRWHIAQARVAVVTPRWEEPFGLVAAEALACGTPVAAFARGALPDIIGPAGTLARADDCADLARAIHKALAIESSDCRRRAETVLDSDVMIARYEQIYAEVCAAPILPAAAAAAG